MDISASSLEKVRQELADAADHFAHIEALVVEEHGFDDAEESRHDCFSLRIMDQVREQQLDGPDRASATLEDHKRMLDKVREQQLDDPDRASLDFVWELK